MSDEERSEAREPRAAGAFAATITVVHGESRTKKLENTASSATAETTD
ncbi:hypothetical protein [Halorarum halobium]|nr:hypothetical protein [Halobaculum sp. XH14]